MEKTLVILAAGMGSRFGGIKQIEPIGPNGEIISDYNIYNAIKYGFNKVVFIIRKENIDIFEKKITEKYKNKITIEYAFQEFDSIYTEYKIPPTRTKMLGTVHALLCAKDKIKGMFAVINADDFYGENAFDSAAKCMNTIKSTNEQYTVNYPLYKVSNQKGEVKRGLCFKDNKNTINKVLESYIKVEDNKYFARELDKQEYFEINYDIGCAMNFFIFNTQIFKLLELYYIDFLNHITDTNECLLSIFLNLSIINKKIVLNEVLTDSNWMGVTYKEDLDELKNKISDLIKNKTYPNDLWN